MTNAISSLVVRSPSTVEQLTVTPSGSVTHRVNMIVRVSCGADYYTFPFDTVKCDFVIGTWLPAAFIKVLANFLNVIRVPPPYRVSQLF